jgi:hypothetical protein
MDFHGVHRAMPLVANILLVGDQIPDCSDCFLKQERPRKLVVQIFTCFERKEHLEIKMVMYSVLATITDSFQPVHFKSRNNSSVVTTLA